MEQPKFGLQIETYQVHISLKLFELFEIFEFAMGDSQLIRRNEEPSGSTDWKFWSFEMRNEKSMRNIRFRIGDRPPSC